MENTGEILKTNSDTSFIKIIAIAAMLSDHVGKVFFPGYPIFQIFGRMAFPIFAYCAILGALYTHDIKNYLKRLLVFALVSQPFYVLAFSHTLGEMKANWFYPNVIFTLFFTSAFTYAMSKKDKKIFIPLALALMLLPLDYGYDALLLALIIYLLRNKPFLSFVLTAAYLATAFFTAKDLCLFGLNMGMQGFSVLSVPLIFCHTNFNPKINKYFFYAFYPLHLFIIFLIYIAI